VLALVAVVLTATAVAFAARETLVSLDPGATGGSPGVSTALVRPCAATTAFGPILADGGVGSVDGAPRCAAAGGGGVPAYRSRDGAPVVLAR
jgi:hypothetical protein